jgi:aerobic-type carbon monoxide dehydrogenase small subunit (CoxS/CutS family)
LWDNRHKERRNLMAEKIHFILNNRPVSIEVDGNRKLLWVLRTDLGITGPKYGCGEGICGACTVLVNNEAVPSCQIRVKDVAGAEITTIEGLEKDGNLHPLQRAFIEHDALQCGFCTPGMILKAHSLLTENPSPSRKEIAEAMENNLCRCGAHTRILDAIETAAREMKGGKGNGDG